MEGDGEVLQFHRGDGRALLLLNWIICQPHASEFVRYEIDYATSSISAEKQDGLVV